MESVQFNAALALTDAIIDSSTEKLYQRLGLESLGKRRYYRKAYHFFKIFKEQTPEYSKCFLDL